MKKSQSNQLAVAPDWSRARKYLDAAKKSAQVTLAYQVLVGKEIAEIRKQFSIQHGNNQRTFHGERSTWNELVKSELGISEATAWRYHQLWEGAKPRLKKLGISDGELFFEILDLPLSKLSDQQLSLLEKATHKLTDGYTQGELFEEWGLAKKPQGSGATGGHHPKQGAAAVDPDAPAENARLMLMVPFQELVGSWDKHWANLDRAHLETLEQGFSGMLIDLRKALKK